MVEVGRRDLAGWPTKSAQEPVDKVPMTSRSNGAAGQASDRLLSEFVGDSEMAELIDFFISEVQQRIGAMADAMEMGDLSRLRSHVHQLRGAAGGYGFPSITQSAAELETALRAQPSDVARRFDALLALCRRAVQT